MLTHRDNFDRLVAVKTAWDAGSQLRCNGARARRDWMALRGAAVEVDA
ncbi:MAG: hypothetical protein IAE86_18115 [Burkholderiaceae bacterium]|nr:hypothetical protein [Burkholderiaceae bacterium]